jgi:hypothetical protein
MHGHTLSWHPQQGLMLLRQDGNSSGIGGVNSRARSCIFISSRIEYLIR